MSPEEFGTKTHCAGEDQQQLISQSVGRVDFVCVFVWRRGPVSDRAPARVTPSRGGVTSSSQTPLLVGEEASIQNI
jgi:hypothetical protein